MTTRITLLIIFISLNLSFASEMSVKERIILTNDKDERFEALEYGVDSKASDRIDTAMGEFEIPGHPPTGLHAYFFIPDPDSNHLLPSYKDIRHVPADSQKFYVVYKFTVNRETNTRLYIEWSTLPLTIESAVISDILSGDFFYADMKKTNKVEVSNEYVNIFFVKVWYNKNPTDYVTDENYFDDDILIYPNPVSDKLVIEDIKKEELDYKIYSQMGSLLQIGTLNLDNNLIEMKSFPVGIYYVLLTDKEGRKRVKKVLKSE